MALLDPVAAQHFCASFGDSGASAPASLRSIVRAVRPGATYTEGSKPYAIFRDAALREVERCLMLSASHYRRSHDLLTPSACPWAHVTMYYGTYFAAHALLGMFGGWATGKGQVVIDVNKAAAGSLEFKARTAPLMGGGPHKTFWEFFYQEVPVLTPWVSASAAVALSPVSGDPFWMSETRNDINYDSFASTNLIGAFSASFRTTIFPASLPGALNTQFHIFSGLLGIASSFARDFGLETDALKAIAKHEKRRPRVKALVFSEKPSKLGSKAKQKVALG